MHLYTTTAAQRSQIRALLPRSISAGRRMPAARRAASCCVLRAAHFQSCPYFSPKGPR